MPIIKILDRYINKVIFSTVIIVLFVTVSLSSIIKFVDQLKKTGQGNYSIIGAGIYTMLSIPKDIQIFFPISALLGTALGIGLLSRYNEIIIMQSSGFTKMQIILSVIKIILILLLFTMIIGEWIIPYSEQIARNYRAQAIYGSSLLSTQHKLWIKDGYSFVYIDHVKGHDELIGLSIYKLNQNHDLNSIIYAKSAKFDINKRVWFTFQVNEIELQNSHKIINNYFFSKIWNTNLTPEKLSVVVLSPDTLSIKDLFYYIKYLKFNGQDVGRYQLSMWNKIFQPVSLSVMVLVTLTFIFKLPNNTSIGTYVITGIIFGFSFYIFNQIFGPLMLVYNVPPILGATLPTIVFFMVSLYLFIKDF